MSGSVPPPPAPTQQWNAGYVYSYVGCTVAGGVLTIGPGMAFEINVVLPTNLPAGTYEVLPVAARGLLITSCRLNNPGASAMTATWNDGATTIVTVSATGTVATATPAGGSYTVAVGDTVTLTTTGVPASNGSATIYGIYQ